MSDLLNVIITTYDDGNYTRTELLNATFESLREWLEYANIHYIITDDSTPEVHEYNTAHVQKSCFKDYVTVLNTNRKGVGFAKNNALRLAFESSPYVLLLEDDWLLQSPLNISPHIKTLTEHSDVGMIRYGYLGGDMTAQYTSYSDVTYWKLLHKSGFYVYSGQVSLRHKRFYDAVGYHVEGVSAGKEEEEMCHRYNDMKEAPVILWPAGMGCTMNSGLFKNIGLDSSTNGVEI